MKKILSDKVLDSFSAGNHYRTFDILGAHPHKKGTMFRVWAPDAVGVSVIGSFNNWDEKSHKMKPLKHSGIWEVNVKDAKIGDIYKFRVFSCWNDYVIDKADPVGFYHGQPPENNSIICELDYKWGDSSWMRKRKKVNALDAPINIYEMHIGSWMRHFDNGHYSYLELIDRLVGHLKYHNFTHVEFLPVMEHPYYGSWGYQATGFFAPSSRFGSPTEFMQLVDILHQNDIGVILDYVPSHFPSDDHGLAYFNGSSIYEHPDPRRGYHPDWNSLIFDYGRPQVKDFLISSAVFWLEKYHIDALRVDAVASMLYLDYSRNDGEWEANIYGGNENLEAIEFIKCFNQEVHRAFPSVLTIAEESTAWPQVTGKVEEGGLGFDMKWDMGWMHDTLMFFGTDPIYRSYKHDKMTFRMLYAYNEKFCLSLSHDEVVYGKGSLLGKMQGDEFQKFANLRCLLAYMFVTPGKKLNFMGAELGQFNEWNHEGQLDWHILDYDYHNKLTIYFSKLGEILKSYPSMHSMDFDPEGFRWMVVDDSASSVFAIMRKGKKNQKPVLCILNLTPVYRHKYPIKMTDFPYEKWKVILNSDSEEYGGSNVLQEYSWFGLEEREIDGSKELFMDVESPGLSSIFLVPESNQKLKTN